MKNRKRCIDYAAKFDNTDDYKANTDGTQVIW